MCGRFNRHDGTRGRLELRASAFRDYRELERQLRDADAILPNRKEDLRKLLEALAQVVPQRRTTLLARAGWLESFLGFSVGDRVLGQAPEGAMSPTSRRGKDDVSGRLYVRGTAADWRRKVSSLAPNSSLLMFIMSIPFAAPLLRPLGQSSFAIVLSGRTGVGKTVATLAAASAQGLRQKEDMLTWSITDARLEELLPEWNDLMVPIDDLMTMAGSWAQRLLRVQELAYRLASGRERDRHSSFKGAAPAGEWRTILLTQSELSVAEMTSGHQQRLGGAALRLGEEGGEAAFAENGESIPEQSG